MVQSVSECNVRVGVRVRPLTSKEIQQGGKLSLVVSQPSVSIGQRRFTYDAVFDSNIEQQELYDSISAPLLTSYVDGYNATIMAYGQTGSGKTFTMGSEAHSQPESSSHTGLIPRFIEDFFLQMQSKKEVSDKGGDSSPVLLDYSMRASFLEVYGEDVFDLLNAARSSLPLREDSEGGVVIAGLTSRPISDPAEALQVLHEGTMNRTTAATLMNLTSSRSHAVFTIYLTQVIRTRDCEEVDVTTTSKFTFVDLAGSERMKKTGAEGERAREGIKINEGLLALGNVINALADEERLAKEKKIHVPYRQSKLTRLLQDALGGNSQTLFLACVSPSDTNASETLSTMHYANRARNIRNAPTKNVDATAAELQRLNALTRILQCELIKSRFRGTDGGEGIGQVNDELMERKDVEEYIRLIHQRAAEMYDSSKPLKVLRPVVDVPSKPPQHNVQPKDNSTMVNVLDPTPVKAVPERFDDYFLIDVNPDEDMAILDHLLQMQQHDQAYDKERRLDDERLIRMDGDLEREEAMLLQLRESLKMYHSLKKKYEELMAEVQQLEAEKENLADQLEKAKADPSSGSSAAIKRQLETVELSLSRARRETLSHRAKYKTAEEQAKRCRVLERKIGELRQAKNNLVKKQKEAAARYKETAEAKTKELLTLRRKEKASEMKMTKLRTEMQHHKSNLEKRKNYCTKLSEKLKKTETHLTKLLAMRQRNLVERAGVAGVGSRKTVEFGSTSDEMREGKKKSCTLSEDEIKSKKFVFFKMVWEKVSQMHLQNQLDDRLEVYNDTMRNVVGTVKLLSAARRKHKDEKSAEALETVKELEISVADAELKLELLGSELNDIRSKMPQDPNNPALDGEEAVQKILLQMPSHVLRSMLTETFLKLVGAETERKKHEDSISRKDAAMLSFESEVAELNNKVDVLTKDRADRRAMVETGEDPVETAMRLKTELACLEEELHRTFEDLNVTKPKVRELDMELQLSKQEHTKLKEVLALAEASLTSKRGSDGSKETLQQLQQLWEELGIDAKIREQDMNDIQSSFKDTCSKKLNEAIAMKYETEKKTLQLSHRLVSMQKALGITSADSIQQQSSLNLSDRLCKLCTQVDQIEIPYKYASARRERIIMVTNELSATLGLSLVQLPSNLRVLMQQTANDSNSTTDIGRRRRASMMEGLKTVLDAIDGFGEKPDIEGVLGGESECSSGEDGNSTRFVVLPANSLESDFLSGCESEIADLRVKKSEFLVRSRELQQEVSCLVRDMHLSVRDSMVVLEESAQKKERVFPKWWSKEQTESILRVLTTSAEQISSSSDLQHLELIHETFVGVANCRRSFINALRNIVESAQETLLNIVGRELDASEAYASFHDALFRLPALSKDLALACISEMEALVIGVDAMTQSEIEALTVVWEALNISSKDRREFWGRVDKPRSLQGKTTPFDKFEDDLVSDSEEWIIPGFEKAMKVYRELDGKLRKLNCIHEEVEKLRSRQDTKSQILSLDSEVRILNVKLQDFEDLKCNKNRLLTKKNSGTSLLKEERFRKQMQGKFVSKLGQLSSLLRSWEINEGRAFDASLLSDDVRVLLDEPDKMENWVEKRTKLMPLRTVQAKTPAQKGPHETVVSKSIGVKRSAPLSRHISDITPPRKRIATAKSRSNAEQNVGRANGITKSVLSSNKRKVTSKPISSGENKEMRSQDELSTSKTSTKRLKRKEPTTLPPFGRILSEVTSPVSDVKENSRD